MSEEVNFYGLLGVSPDAEPGEIRRAFRRRVREYHPDLNDDPRAPAQFTTLKRAYDTLASPKERDVYDRLGHEEYVSERISGLPSVDSWETPREANRAVARDDATTPETEVPVGRSADETVTGDDTVDIEANGPGRDDTRSRGPTRPESEAGTDAEPAFDLEFEFDFDSVDIDGDEPNAAGESLTHSAGTRVDAGEDGSLDGFVVGPDVAPGPKRPYDGDEPGSVPAPEIRKSATASGAGTARGPKTAPDLGEPTPSGPTATQKYTDDGTDEERSIRDRVERGVRRLLGWPLVGIADAVYLAALLAYVAANAAGFETFLSTVSGEGLVAALSGDYGIGGPAALVDRTAAGPLVSATVVLGVVTLPAVYLPLVRSTRRNRHSWRPSYLYVVGAAVPAAWTGLATVVGSTLVVDLVVYGVVPVVTMCGLVVFGQVWPRWKRLVRQYAYRLTD